MTGEYYDYVSRWRTPSLPPLPAGSMEAGKELLQQLALATYPSVPQREKERNRGGRGTSATRVQLAYVRT